MIRFFFRFLREKEKTRVFDKDSRAEARRESQAKRVKWAGKKRISAQNKNNKCLNQLLFEKILSEGYLTQRYVPEY
jgi:hypothetical protein